MRNKRQLYLGGIVTILGVVLLAGSLLGISLGRILFPLACIGLGAWVLLRSRKSEAGGEMRFMVIGDWNRSGPWVVADEDAWLLIGDAKLDLTSADIPFGETHFSVNGLIGDVDVIVPHGVGVALSSAAVVCDVKFFGEGHEGLFVPVSEQTADYETAEKRLSLHTAYLVGDVNVRYG